MVTDTKELTGRWKEANEIKAEIDRMDREFDLKVSCALIGFIAGVLCGWGFFHD